MSSDGTTRLSIEVENRFNEQLNIICPWGTKAQVIRALLDCLVMTYKETNGHVMSDLLNGRVKLVVQNLNNGERNEENR